MTGEREGSAAQLGTRGENDGRDVDSFVTASRTKGGFRSV